MKKAVIVIFATFILSSCGAHHAFATQQYMLAIPSCSFAFSDMDYCQLGGVCVGEVTNRAKDDEGVRTQSAAIAHEGRMGRAVCLQRIKGALAKHDPRVTFPVGKVTDRDFAKVAGRVYSNESAEFPILRDTCGFEKFSNPEYAWDSDANQWYVVGVSLTYFLTEKELSAVDKKVRRIAEEAKKRKSRIAKVRYIHDYLVRETAYATAKAQWAKVSGMKAYSSYGVLKKHRGFCYGYSIAFVRVLRAAGVSKAYFQAVAVGKSNSANHAIGRVGKKYYDITWDDARSITGRDRGRNVAPSYKYFDKTKRQMRNLGYKF